MALSRKGLPRWHGCILAVVLLCGLTVQTYAVEICLNMIAKNEAKEILDCLEPLAPELGGWTLCDTGSTDDTISIVKNFFRSKDIPGSVANHAWQDFGHNRNLCIKAGIEWSKKEARRQGLKREHFCDYLLFLDADQILHRPEGMRPGDLKKQKLTFDGYHMTERGVGVTYSNMRLASTRMEWEWVGEVHEYVHRKDGKWVPQQTIEGLWFNHDATGGQGGKRFSRDEAILLKAVKERPADPRARFYLGNTLRALQKDEEAITQYIERVKLGSWEEEAFMAAFNIAELAKKQWEEGKIVSPQVQNAIGIWGSHFAKSQITPSAAKKEEKAYQAAKTKMDAAIKASKDPKEDPIVKAATKEFDDIKRTRRERQFPLIVSAYLSAITVLPYRPEPWVTLAKLYRMEKTDQPKCYAYAAGALAQGKPRPDALFLSTNMARYDILDEMCACAYYVDSAVEEGRKACRDLQQILVTDLALHPANTYLQGMLERAKGNLGWYAKKSPENALAEECPDDSEGLCKAKREGLQLPLTSAAEMEVAMA